MRTFVRRPGHSLICAALTSAALAVAPSAASAQAGWKIDRYHFSSTYSSRSSATHCGASMFGTYTIRGTAVFKKGTLRGKSERIVGAFDLKNDGQRHHYRLISLTGSALSVFNAQERAALRRAVARLVSQVSVQVVGVHGDRVTADVFLGNATSPTTTTHFTLLHIKSC